MHSARIRPVTKADVSDVVEIDRLSFDPADQYPLAFYDGMLDDETLAVLGAEDERGRIAAWVLFDRTCNRIRSVSVHPQSRRRGYARALIEAVTAGALGDVDLLVDPENAAAIALYRERGFAAAEPDPQMPHRIRMRLKPLA